MNAYKADRICVTQLESRTA